MSRRGEPVSVNRVRYAWPVRPLVVVCIDGGDPAYLERGVEAGLTPALAGFMREGFAAEAAGTVPSFTCPNNLSIVTGARPDAHGISGNFYLERASGEAVVMTGPELLRAETILAAFAERGARVAAVTAKDKLRAQLGAGLEPFLHLDSGSVCFSAQCAGACTAAEHGIADALALAGMPQPDMYSAALSLFVLAAGVRLLERGGFDLLYLSLTDYVQHKHAPGEPEADAFYAGLDGYLGRLAELGATVAVTADHGMSDKARPDGSPNVIWLQDELDARLGAGRTRVICPITDPFVGHHGALGGFVRVYCAPDRVGPVIELCAALPGVELACPGAEAARRFALPLDREGDVAVVADAATAIGAARRDHDLSGLHGRRLRTHGGVAESRVPVVLSRPLRPERRARAEAEGLGSHQIFELALNATE